MVRISALIITALFVFVSSAFAQGVGPLLQKDLTDLPNREGMMLIVDIPPGHSSPKHRHNAHTFVVTAR